jgi:hypothetical protein
MGTSRASGGSPSKVPMVPPWVPDIPVEDPTVPNEPDHQDEPKEANEDKDRSRPQRVMPPTAPVPIAPAGRFASARRSLGSFAASGGKGEMRRGVGQYVRIGMGGSGTAARRFGGTARTAGALYDFLGGGAPGRETPEPLERNLLEGESGREIIDAVIEATCPVDGSQDAEASRNSLNDVLSELIQRHPDADLLTLSEEQRVFVTERFVGMDVFRRFVLDVGTAIHDKAPTISSALSRLKEVREYIRETISASFRKLRTAGQKLTRGRVANLIKRALEDAFDVFSGYA